MLLFITVYRSFQLYCALSVNTVSNFTVLSDRVECFAFHMLCCIYVVYKHIDTLSPQKKAQFVLPVTCNRRMHSTIQLHIDIVRNLSQRVHPSWGALNPWMATVSSQTGFWAEKWINLAQFSLKMYFLHLGVAIAPSPPGCAYELACNFPYNIVVTFYYYVYGMQIVAFNSWMPAYVIVQNVLKFAIYTCLSCG